jgi:hypothetical protein
MQESDCEFLEHFLDSLRDEVRSTLMHLYLEEQSAPLHQSTENNKLAVLKEATAQARRWFILREHGWPIEQLLVIDEILFDLLEYESERNAFWFYYLLDVDVQAISEKLSMTKTEVETAINGAVVKVKKMYCFVDGYFVRKSHYETAIWLAERSGYLVKTTQDRVHAELILESFSTETSKTIKTTHKANTYPKAAAILGCTDRMIEGTIRRAVKLSKTWWKMAKLGWRPKECREAMLLLKHLVLDERTALEAYWLDGRKDSSGREKARLSDCLKFAGLKYELKPLKPLRLKKEVTVLSPRVEAKLVREAYRKLVSMTDKEGKITGQLKDIAPIVFPEASSRKALRDLYHAHRWLVLARWIEYDHTIDHTGVFFVLTKDRPDVNSSQKENARIGGLFVSYWEILDEVIFQLRDHISSESDSFPASLRDLSKQALLAKLPPDCKVSPDRIKKFAISASFYFRRNNVFLRDPESPGNHSRYCLGDRALEAYRRLCS